MTHRYLAALLFMGTLSFSQAREMSVFSGILGSEPGGTLSTTYNSRYWNEGRDFLENDDIWSTQLNYTLNSLTAGVWYGKSTEVTYEELQLGLAYRHEFTDCFEMYAGYAYIDYLSIGTAVSGSEGSDNEFSLGMLYTGCPMGVDLGLDLYYSDDAEGFFAEFYAGRDWEISEKWDFNLRGVLGINQGYIPDGSDGLNHVALIAGFEYEIIEDLTFGLHGVRSFGLDRSDPGDINTDDFLHGRASLVWSF